MESKLIEVQRRLFEVGVKPQICYQRWIDEVCAFLNQLLPISEKEDAIAAASSLILY